MNYDSFEEWYDRFVEEVRALNYHGPIDKDAFEDDYNAGIEPHYAAETFVEEMNS